MKAMWTITLWAGLLGLTIAGCAVPNRATQVKYALETKQNNGELWAGELDADLRPVDGRAAAYSQETADTVAFLGIEGGILCLGVEGRRQFFRGMDTPESDRQGWLKTYRKRRFVFEAYDSLEALKAAAWPEATANQVTSVRLVDHDITRSKCNRYAVDGECHYTESARVKAEICGTAPTIGPATQYLTALERHKDSFALYMWKVAPNPARGAQPADAPAPEASPDEASPDEAAP